MRKALSIIGIVLGLLLVLAAVGLKWIGAPALAVLPADTDTTRTYSGTAAALLNPAAIAAPGSGPIVLRGVPITVTHHTKVLGTKGSNALVSDAKSVQTGGTPVAAADYRYAVDRTDLDRGSGYPGVVKQTGLTFNWPIRAKKQDYLGWVADTQRGAPLKFTGTAKRGGVSTYVYTLQTAAEPITDPQVLGALPKGLPKANLVRLAGGLGLAPAQLALLQQALPPLPDPVPFAYTYQVEATYWVAPVTGIVVDIRQHEVRTLGLALGATTAPVTPVMDISFTSQPATLAAAAKDARDKGAAITSVYTTVPFALVTVGAVLVLLGLIGLALRRRGSAPA